MKGRALTVNVYLRGIALLLLTLAATALGAEQFTIFPDRKELRRLTANLSSAVSTMSLGPANLRESLVRYLSKTSPPERFASFTTMSDTSPGPAATSSS